MAEKALYKVDSDMVDLLARTEDRLNGLAAIIEERAYGLADLESNEEHDMNADNLIASILRDEADRIKRAYERMELVKRGESRE